jgi:hypothetical protein
MEQVKTCLSFTTSTKELALPPWKKVRQHWAWECSVRFPIAVITVPWVN